MKKKVFVGFVIIILIAFLLNACVTTSAKDLTFTQAKNSDVEVGDIIGIFGVPHGYLWRFVLVKGEGDADNNLFDIVDTGNQNIDSLKLKDFIPTTSRTYSVRISLLGQNQTGPGLQRSFTFIITGKDYQFPTEFSGTWFRYGDDTDYIMRFENNILIQESRWGTNRYNLLGRSGDTYFFHVQGVGSWENFYQARFRCAADIKIENGNLVFREATNFYGGDLPVHRINLYGEQENIYNGLNEWRGAYRKR